MLVTVDSLALPALDAYRDLAHPDRLAARGLFVAEGRLVVARLVALASHRLHSVLLTPAAQAAMSDVIVRVPPEVPVYVAAQDTMNAVAGFNIHRGCLALAERPAPVRWPPRDLATVDRVLVLEGVNNPDNVGGLFRAGAALGAVAVLLGPRCGDPLYRKAIRTSMGATLALPTYHAGRWPDALDDLRGAGVTIVACTPDPVAPSLYAVDLPRRAAVLVGAEGPGLSAAARAAADLQVRVPMHGGLDSLNVTTAAAIVLSALDRPS
ncbi:MAG: TrmH family RNA methyltransferase [Vicinamibacterales bacterium]